MKKIKSLFLISILSFTLFYSITQTAFADFSTESNTITTRVGNPAATQNGITGVGGDRIASAAQQIAEQLLRWDDPKRVSSYNCSPTDSLGYGFNPTSGKYSFHCWSRMADNNWAGDDNVNYFECTEFVRAAFKLASPDFENAIIQIFGNAGTWASKAKNNPDFSVFFNAKGLKPGDIIEMPQHMAIVLEADGNTVKIAQSATSDAPIMTFPIDSNGLLNMQTGSPVYCGQTQGCSVSFIRFIKKP